jgi:glycosyltransferase involved in cell wall biosynthesis
MLMEAMACGLPAVSTNLVGIPDLIRQGETGLLAEPEDVDGLADCLEKLLQDPDLAQRLARAGVEHVRDTFDLSKSLNSLVGKFKHYLETK